ncbi:RuBisCO accumulation factor 1 [Halomicronema sp. CCY15110]|uniref:RuBisCO accumulation factor 1 n=1 Tax=Halomicronema sp. CCY15110 TaxID=2767773 RepID=UPI0019505F4C|nr:RuBisCO accumulation factor 1 [Halomicronema sp. CCY15110]
MASSDSVTNSPVDIDQLVTQLRHKAGTWVEWGKACQALQKSGLRPQEIFERTGFEPPQQNQVIVGAQVYDSIVAAGTPAPVLAHFEQRGSDILYELRILTQRDRARAAELARQQGLDADTIKDVAKALKEYAYFKEPPSGFSDTAGDAIAYTYWKLARQQSDLAARSRLIAQALRFATSEMARQQVESLLTDLTVVKSRPVPTLPTYRLETDSELPLVVPLAGVLPLSTEDFQAVPVIEPEEPFGIVKTAGPAAWVPVPGWQVVLQAEDPVGILAKPKHLPNVQNPDNPETVLLVIDRAQRDWDADSYCLTAQGDTVAVEWLPEPSDRQLLGKLLVVMRPKRILDENYTRELMQFDD